VDAGSGLTGSDVTGLAGIFALHRSELLRFLVARCGAADTAEDLLQDLWIKASSRPDGPIANPRAYLFRMANNLVLDLRRAQHRAMRRNHAWIVANDGGDSLIEEWADPALPVDEELVRQQEAALLQTAIAALPAGAQRALRLHRLEGHSQGEVAQIMGISRSGVEKHLANAMKHLKTALADCGFFPAMASQDQGQASGPNPQPETRS